MSIAAFRAAAVFMGAMLIASAAAALDRNGNWWLTQTPNERSTYVVGFFDGIHFELDRAQQELTNLLVATSFPQPCDQVCTKVRLDQSFADWQKLLNRFSDFDNVTAGQLVAGADALYADYRNRSILLKDVLDVVMWGIKGVKQELIDGRLTYLRSQK